MPQSSARSAALPTETNAEWEARRLAATPRGVSVYGDFYVDRAENAEIWDIEGNRYIDFAAGIAVLNVGHRHPRVTAAVKAQVDQFLHTCYQVAPYASYVSLAEKIAARAPGAHAKKTIFLTTGAEAVENAVKIARAATGRPGVIAFGGGFHGRTNLTMALTGKVAPYKIGFGPFAGDIYHATYPDALHGVTVADALASVKKLFKTDIDPQRVAAILFEPVQGEGGFIPASKEFVEGLRAIADEDGILLIADEVQTGFARTGKFFAIENFGVPVDLMTFAKSLAAGMPLSGVVGRAEIMDAPGPGGLGGTYAGNPLAVAAAHAVIDIIDDEKLCARANELGARLTAALKASGHPAIGEVRALGSMVAVEFLDPKTHEPAANIAKKVQAAALKSGLILLTCGTYGNAIRFLYPLTTPDKVFAEALDILSAALSQA